MRYTDILLFQGADPDGIADATSRLLAVVHGINRAHGVHGDQNGLKGDYPVGIAFPRWKAPSVSVNVRLSGGSTGSIFRVFGPESLLKMINEHRLMQSLVMEGRAEPGKIIIAPVNTGQWVSYNRYHRKEKISSCSYKKRHREFIARKTSLGDVSTSIKDKNQSSKHGPYIYLKVLKKDAEFTLIAVQEKILVGSAKTEQVLRFNSYGLTTEGVLPYF